MSRDITKKDLIKSAHKATTDAVNKTRKSGGAVTFQDGKRIIKKFANGDEVVIEVLDKAYVRTQKKRFSLA